MLRSPAGRQGEEKQDLVPCNKMPSQLWLLAKAHGKDLLRGCFSLKEQKQSSSLHVCHPAGALGSVHLGSPLQRGLGSHARASALASLKDHSVRCGCKPLSCVGAPKLQKRESVLAKHIGKSQLPLDLCLPLPLQANQGAEKTVQLRLRITFSPAPFKAPAPSISCARLPRELCSVWSQTGWAQRQCWLWKGGNRDNVLAGKEICGYTKPKKAAGASCMGAGTSQDIRTD